MTRQSEENMKSIFLSRLLGATVSGSDGAPLGKLADAVVSLRSGEYPLLTALVVSIGASTVFVPQVALRELNGDGIRLNVTSLSTRTFERREGEVLLGLDVLGHRLIDVEQARFVKAHDVELALADEGWIARGLDVQRPRWWGGSAQREKHPIRDWRSFEALIGHVASLDSRTVLRPRRALKAAEIADLLESASASEQTELLDRMHLDPELEADVFEELDDNSQAHLLKGLGLTELASVLSRMRADDAADAILDLPQNRRLVVLGAMPDAQRESILKLMSYNAQTAGGLMGLDYIAVAEVETVGHAIALIRAATGQHAEALTTVYTLNTDGVLVGSIGLVQALQQNQDARLSLVASGSPTFAAAEDDIVEITTMMADFNLLTLPVLDAGGRIIGVITVDDALEAAIPEDWRRRGKQGHTAAIPVIRPTKSTE